MAFWLLIDAYSSMMWLTAGCVFGVFTGVNIAQVMQGKLSCGCLGALEVAPSTMMILDLVGVLAIIVVNPIDGAPRRRRLAWSLSLAAVLAGLVAQIGSYTEVFAEANARNGSHTTSWIGHRLPILDAIDLNADLSDGDWLVILHQPGCLQCQRILDACSKISGVTPSFSDQSRVAVLDVTGAGGPYVLADSPANWVFGRLRETEGRTVPAPAVLFVSDGQVVSDVTENLLKGDYDTK